MWKVRYGDQSPRSAPSSPRTRHRYHSSARSTVLAGVIRPGEPVREEVLPVQTTPSVLWGSALWAGSWVISNGCGSSSVST